MWENRWFVAFKTIQHWLLHNKHFTFKEMLKILCTLISRSFLWSWFLTMKSLSSCHPFKFLWNYFLSAQEFKHNVWSEIQRPMNKLIVSTVPSLVMCCIFPRWHCCSSSLMVLAEAAACTYFSILNTPLHVFVQHTKWIYWLVALQGKESHISHWKKRLNDWDVEAMQLVMQNSWFVSALTHRQSQVC